MKDILKKTLGAAVLIGGCTVGLDASVEGLDGTVLGAESAQFIEGPVLGDAVDIRLDRDGNGLDVGFTVEGYEAVLDLDEAVLQVMRSGGSLGLLATLRLDDGRGMVSVPVTVTVSELAGDEFLLTFRSEDDNTPIEGTVVLRVIQPAGGGDC